jgi:hypothetical protein
LSQVQFLKFAQKSLFLKQERRVEEEMAHQVGHIERRRWRKAQRARESSKKKRIFFAI